MWKYFHIMKLYKCTKRTYIKGKRLPASEDLLYRRQDIGAKYPLRVFVNIETGVYLEDDKRR